MKETGILFTQAMDDAAQAGIKTMTRRIAKANKDGHLYACPYGGPGDRLYQKEPFTVIDYANIDGNPSLDVVYRRPVAGKQCRERVYVTPEEYYKFCMWKRPYATKSSLFMFKSLARKWYTITSVRVERLKDISIADCIREGIEKAAPNPYGIDEKTLFRDLWQSINKDRASWESNPWVFVIEFRKDEK